MLAWWSRGLCPPGKAQTVCLHQATKQESSFMVYKRSTVRREHGCNLSEHEVHSPPGQSRRMQCSSGHSSAVMACSDSREHMWIRPLTPEHRRRTSWKGSQWGCNMVPLPPRPRVKTAWSGSHAHLHDHLCARVVDGSDRPADSVEIGHV